jgi:PAS domain S-box-containing protein
MSPKALPVPDDDSLLLRQALAEADTWVWAWDIASDELTEIGGSLEALGWSSEQIGRRQADWDRLIHPEDLAANMESYERHARGDTAGYDSIYRVRTAAGGWRWMHECGRIVARAPDGTPLRMVGTQTDVTARLEAERRGQDAERQLAQLAAELPGLVFQLRLDAGHEIRVERLAGRLAGWFAGSLSWLDAIEAEDQLRVIESLAASAEAAAREWEAGRTVAEWRCEFRVRAPAGSWRWLRAHARPEHSPDGATRWSGYAEDVSVHRELQRSRQDAAVLAAASRAKGELLSRMSHELRTPLNAVLGFAQLMEIDPFEAPGPVQRQRLAAIRQAGNHLLAMIDTVLDLSRIESGALELAPERLDLREAAAQALALMQPEAERLGVTMALRGRGRVAVWADRDRLRQVLLQLLSNAVKFNRSGGQVDVALAALEGQVRLSVRDTGRGMAAEVAASLSSLAAPQGAARAASGMGLAVARSLLSLMGGRLSVRSEPGIGTVASVVLPSRPPKPGQTGQTGDGVPRMLDSRSAELDSATLPWFQSIT